MNSVVVLNRNYEYWTEVDLKKVLKWIVQDKIEVVISHEDYEVGSISFKIKAPLVVRLLSFVGYKPKKVKIPFSSDAVFHRDNNFCQYWHKDSLGKKFKYKCTIEDRTLDHIIPRSKGGPNTFENTVCACRHCNNIIKKNRIPEEAGLELIRKPFEPIQDKNSFVIMRFAFNPKKLSHKRYCEDLLGVVF